jgi:hypothetical protein
MKILTDYSGKSIRLTEERLTHILQRPEMAMMETAIAETVKYPEQVRQSKTDETVLLSYRYYRGTLVGDKWLCAVVKYLHDDAFLLTAYFTDRIKPGEQV